MQQANSWGVQILILWENGRKTLIQEIAHIRFTNLRELRLQGNRIESVEELPRMHMPYIQEISLHQNKIRRVSQIRKAIWPSLSALTLCNNQIGDFHTLSEGSLAKMTKLWAYEELFGETTKLTDPWFSVKLEVKNFISLRIKSFTPSIKRTLEERWKCIRIS